MTKNVELIYSLIQKDLKAQGWDDSAIAEAIAESQRERRATGTDDNTICVKEISYLTQKSLLEVRATPVSPKNSMKVINPACKITLPLPV